MEDPKAAAKRIRYLPETERLMRQFLKLETGLGNSDAFKDGRIARRSCGCGFESRWV